MKLTLKTTILFSSAVAAALNVGQLLSSYQQRTDAFAPTWAYTAPSPAPAKLASALPQTAGSTVPETAPPSADPATAVAARLSQSGLKPDHAALYLSAQARTGTPWQLLAAVHQVETGGSGDTSRRSYAGATGPMQFMPATWNHYALDGDGNDAAQISDVDDAMFTAGRYLAAGGADKGHYNTALYNYNHSGSYVAKVLGIAHRLGL